MYSTIVLHANLQYAEIPKDEIPKVVEYSYIPVLSTLLEIPKIKVVLNFTGVTLEILHNSYPEVIKLLKKGIEKEKFELTACGYSHPIFPLLPITDIRKQIEFNLRVLETTLNYTDVAGFWLPELAYDPTLPHILKEYGFTYIFIDEELYSWSSPLLNDSNPLNIPRQSAHHYVLELNKAKNLIEKLKRYRKAIKSIKKKCMNVDFYPIELKGARGTITGIKVPHPWFIFTSAIMLNYPFVSFKKIKRILKKYRNHKGLVIPYGMDIEFIGYRHATEGRLIKPETFEKFLLNLGEIDDLEFICPSKYLENNKPTDLVYVKTGSWAPDKRLDIWTRDEDNKKLERICDEIRWYMSQISTENLSEELWKHLLLAENSDGRGWDPIPERKLDCFVHALDALKIAKELYHDDYSKKKK